MQDARILQGIAQGERISDRNYFYKLRIQLASAYEIYSLTKQSSMYKGILNLINYHAGGLSDWRNTRKIGFNAEKLESHHIFPRAYIKKAFKGDEEANDLVNSVANRTLIPKLENIKISDKTPSKYLGEIAEKNAGIKQSLQKHLIPVGLLEGKFDDAYLQFLQERAQSIYDLIDEHVLSVREDIMDEFGANPKQ